jgi:hypothetical protein
MREFFHSWKRKVGVVMLILTLPFLLGWIRSILLADFIGTWVGDTSYCFVSHDGILSFERLKRRQPVDSPVRSADGSDGSQLKTVITTAQPFSLSPPTLFWGSHRLKWFKERIGVRTAVADVSWNDFDIDWQASIGPFQVIMANDQTDRAIKISAPYSSIVIPLTILSAWLLLSKQPPAKQVDVRKNPSVAHLSR